MAAALSIPHDRVRDDLWRPLRSTSRTYLAVTTLAALVVAWGLFCWGYQIHHGIGVAGIRRPVMWAFYIVNFVFWIGISHAGTLISAILRLTHARWRHPVTRAAEAITVFALMIGALFPLVHLGRVQYFYWLMPYPNDRGLWPNFRSPLVWDLTAIATYLTGSVIYLYLPLIPDLAQLGRGAPGLRRRLYRLLSLGWTGSDREWHALERAMKLMAGMILAVAVSVHTVVAWDFAMALAPMWHSTIFGPYFVAGAIFSGIAALLIVMAVMRQALHLEAYLEPLHFDYLGRLLLLMSLLWFYFTVGENLTVWYGNEPHEMEVLGARVRGPYAPFFWTMMVCNFAVPFVLLGIRRLRSIRTAVVSSVAVLIGMWLERYLIVVPTLATPRLASAWGSYAPTWVEISITCATFAAMTLLFLLFSKMFPMIAVWEYNHAGHDEMMAATRPVLAPPAGGPRDGANPDRVLTGEFADASSAAEAVEALRARDFDADQVAVFSSQPVELAPGVLDRPSRMSLTAVAGAAGTCLAAVGFVYYTQHNYPLITGGMPLFSLWATGVVFYELTLLGAIGTTFLMFLRESGLLRRRRPAPPPMESGRVYLRVGCEAAQVSIAGECLYRAGASLVSKS